MKKKITNLALIIALLSIIAAGLGVFWQGEGESFAFETLRGETVEVIGRGLYYYDTISYAAQAVAQDTVTLIIGVPLLIAGILLTRKNSRRGYLLLTGTLGYFLYTYTSYVFLSAFNVVFLLYVALFSLTLFTFILAMMGLNPEKLKEEIDERFPHRGIIIFFWILAGFLTLAWMGRIVPALLAGTPPIGLESYTTLVIQGLDLGIIVPASALTAVLLKRRQAWGYALTAVILVKGLTMGMALIAMIIGMLMTGVQVSMMEVIVFPGIAVAALIFTLLMFRSVKETG